MILTVKVPLSSLCSNNPGRHIAKMFAQCTVNGSKDAKKSTVTGRGSKQVSCMLLGKEHRVPIHSSFSSTQEQPHLPCARACQPSTSPLSSHILCISSKRRCQDPSTTCPPLIPSSSIICIRKIVKYHQPSLSSTLHLLTAATPPPSPSPPLHAPQPQSHPRFSCYPARSASRGNCPSWARRISLRSRGL